MIVRELLAKIGFETDETPLNRIENAIDRVRHRMELFAAFEVGKKLFEMTEKFGEWGHELVTTSENIGIGVVALQRLQGAASRMGIESGAMSQGLMILTRHIQSAKEGGEGAWKTFNKLGISSDTVNSWKGAEDAFFGVTDAVANIPDHMERMAVSQELFGRSGRRMVGFLSQGSDTIKHFGDVAEKEGRVRSEKQVYALERVGLAFQKLHSFVQAFFADMAAEVAPSLEKGIKLLQEWYVANQSIIKQNVHTFLMIMAGAIGFIVGAVQAVVWWIQHWNDQKITTEKIEKWAKYIGAVGAALFIVGPILGKVITLINVCTKCWQGFAWALGLIQPFLVWLIGNLGILVSGVFPALGDALVAIAAWISGLSAGSLFLVVGAFMALGAVAHDLYGFFTGKKGPGWISQLEDFAEKIPGIGASLKNMREWIDFGVDEFADTEFGQWLSDFCDKTKELVANMQPLQGWIDLYHKWFGPSAELSPQQKLKKMESQSSAIDSDVDFSSGFGGANSSIVNHVKVDVHVPAGMTPEDSAKNTESGVKGALAQTLRETHRSVKSAEKN